MNTNQLRCILRRDRRIDQQFIDVFALNQFKEFVKQNGLIHGIYVVNDDPITKEGNHWFLVHVEKDCINFVDSFAMDPSFYNVEKELTSKMIRMIPFQLQNYLSDVCGYYCIYFSYFLTRNFSLGKIVNMFSSTNRVQNDRKVYQFVMKKL